MGFSSMVKSLLLATLLLGAIAQARCFTFNFSSFNEENAKDFILNGSYIKHNAIQVTDDVHDWTLTKDQSGRALYKRPFSLGSKSKGKASFNSTFVLNISNNTDTNPGGEGLAFILTGSTDLPLNSHGQWLGIVNESTNGSATAKIVAVEFDTRKSYPEDLDDNHVGLDVNSIYSITQQSLSIKLVSGADITVKVEYDGELLKVFVGENASTPVISATIDLVTHLPERLYVGFSASTGNDTQLNCVKSWEFSGLDLYKEDPNLLWVWIIVPAVLVFFFVFVFLYWKWKSKGEVQVEEVEDDGEVEICIQGSSTAPRKFRLEELKAATENFKNKLGEGGFGTVYEGFLENKAVAVKRFSRDAREGKQDFIAEVTTIGNLNHKNLVKLLGWCSERNELILVYEFMPNKSLDKFIFCNQNPGPETDQITLNWGMRYRIINGVAQALDYLHNGCEKRVLHRDIKASNIMLDSEFNARLGDFGLARTIHCSDQTHHSTKAVAGTPGYMAPESILTWRATVETDIYAFGVLVLEVVSGRSPGDQSKKNKYTSLVDWAWEDYSRERILDVVDLHLNGDFNKEEAECVLILALACCHPNPYQRPSTKTALRVLTGEVAPPLIPKAKPAFMWPAMEPPSFNEDSKDYFFGGDQPSPFSEPSGR
ncbi:hypothetical protein PVL29_010834 [Vitis rotundifolia]|uniref:non-specific serine/threonine protein kinase n=1 Tax=Vitis rotundifolia TaxID=103349 RepID=A0AA39DU06_VITRO|nr:hypothetical protein PVL29_010834 [Vitis rotundifolia]